MKKFEVLYDWPVAQIVAIADSSEADKYATTLGPELLDEFVAVTEALRSHAGIFFQAKVSRLHTLNWPEVRKLVDEFSTKFATFQPNGFTKLKLFLLLSESLASMAPDLDAEAVDENLFGIYPATHSLPCAWFARENGRAFEDSVVFLKSAKLGDLESVLRAEPLPPKLLFHVLATLSAFAGDVPESMAILKRNAHSSADIDNFIKLQLLMDGRQVHLPKTSGRGPMVDDRDAVNVDIRYGQWTDVLLVLSEYNSRPESLLKLLTLYQVVEALMFKHPIVKLESAKGGGMFSLREFKSLYNSVSVNELNALDALLKVLFPLALGANSIHDAVAAEWIALEAKHGAHVIAQELAPFGLKFNGSFGGTNCPSNYAKLLYTLRNSVVHNKETEFHLTSETMTNVLGAVIEEFLLPTLERVVFKVVSSRNTQLWYSNQRLNLY